MNGIDRPRMRLIEWRPLLTLRGFATLELPSGLIVREVTVHEKNGKWWVGLPAKAQIDRDGQVIKNEVGNIQYAAILNWRDRDLADRFSDTVVALVRVAHPEIEAPR